MNTTRVIFAQGVQQKTVQLVNDGDTPMLVQSWIDDGDPRSTPDNASPAFVVLPPVLRIEPGQQREIRLMGSGTGLPVDRESLFWLNVFQLPPELSSASATEKVRFSLRTQLKVLWRPDGIQPLNIESMKMLDFRHNDGVISVKNKTKWNITLVDLAFGGYLSHWFVVAPDEEKVIFTINAPVAINNKIDFAVINDDGNKWGLSALIK